MFDDFTAGQNKVLVAVIVTCSVLSFLGSAFIIICYNRIKELRSFAFKLVMWMSLSDLFRSIGNMMGDAGSAGSDTCRLQALLKSYFGLSSIMWSTSIALVLHMGFVRGHPNFGPREIQDHALKFYVACWGWPLIWTIIPAITRSYGDVGPWCWILDNNATGRAWRFLQLYIPLWVAVFYCAYVYLRVWNKFRALHGDDAESTAAGRKMMYYPLVLVLAYFFATVNRLYQTFGGGNVFWLTLFHIFFSSLHGLFNSITYGATPQVREEVRARWFGGPGRASNVGHIQMLDGNDGPAPIEDEGRPSESVGEEKTNNPRQDNPGPSTQV